ncbi:hypothetical protein CN939_30190 [Bacillus thuringiensis]|uniref:Group-specific protein n=1 Tax=Bacillus thuringiensis TaxID=1428 RepID=A0AB36V326_BACTU|nr:hypothetical protein TU67_28950 [Bacillus cereus]PEF12078.1 hypothetical protein CON23_13020 [Bacillus thuringiensis]PFC24260.1 hypothetical protein CN299_31290 [Bacillus thuringiensis]PFS51142.1 hypothetical protein COK64_31820 [Bacillus thuringiensis]PGL57445.1 hypothetical protein CN939_30190 [Bacillus thuringiensis]
MKTIKGKLFFVIDIIGCILCIIMLIITLVNFRTWVHPCLFLVCGLIFLINIVNNLKGKRRNLN